MRLNCTCHIFIACMQFIAPKLGQLLKQKYQKMTIQVQINFLLFNPKFETSSFLL